VAQQAAVRGRQWPKGTSGNPLGGAVVAKRITELFESMRADFHDLTAVETELLLQAARLMWRAERVRDGDTAVRLTNSASRLLTNLRNGRRQREPAMPTLQDYVRSRREAAKATAEPA
jgi:hypothetical protein